MEELSSEELVDLVISRAKKLKPLAIHISHQPINITGLWRSIQEPMELIKKRINVTLAEKKKTLIE